MKERSILLAVLLVYGLVALALIVGDRVQPLAELASNRSEQINQSLKMLFGSATAVLLVVEGLLIYSALRGRLGLGAATMDSSLETLWVLLPSAIVIVISVYSIRVLTGLERPTREPLIIEVTASQWEWSFYYPESDVTSRELHLPRGRAAELRLISRDVVHSFWVPAFGGKIDAVPHRRTVWTVLPQRLGSYPIVCAEYCGPGHSDMQAAVWVEAQADFQAWLQDQ